MEIDSHVEVAAEEQPTHVKTKKYKRKYHGEQTLHKVRKKIKRTAA